MTPLNTNSNDQNTKRCWLIIGGSGRLGSAVSQNIKANYPNDYLVSCYLTQKTSVGDENIQLDLTSSKTIKKLFHQFQPTHVIFAAGITNPNRAFQQKKLSKKLNIESPSVIAHLCDKHHARFIYPSTDFVFDGNNAPYDELSIPKPENYYGRTKLKGEKKALKLNSETLIIRLPLLWECPSSGRIPWLKDTIEKLKKGEVVAAYHDEYRTPLHYQEAASILVELILTDATGVIHAGGTKRYSIYELLEEWALSRGIKMPNIIPVARDYLEEGIKRPYDLSLKNSKLCDYYETPLSSVIEWDSQH